jgi:hypothetical protein
MKRNNIKAIDFIRHIEEDEEALFSIENLITTIKILYDQIKEEFKEK